MRKTIKRLMLLPLLSAMTLLMPTACSDNSDNPVDDNEVVIDQGDAEFTPQKLSMANVWVADGVDADLKQAFEWASVGKTDNPNLAGILVVNKLTDVSEEALKRVFDLKVNGLVCVVNPVKAELDAYCESHDWADINTSVVTDSTMIFGFNSAGQLYDIIMPTASEEFLTNLNKAQDYYVFISSMLKDYAFHMENGADDKDSKSIESFGSQYHYQKTYTFFCHEEFKHVWLSSEDYHDGSGSLTACFDIYTAHVYEGEPGAGDYYAVNMTASIASAGMWKGKGDNRHGGVHVRWVGAYATNFFAEAHLREHNADWYQDTSDHIIFPSGGYPSPSTTVGQTTYNKSNSFSLDMSQTVGGKSKSGSGGASSESSKNGSLSFSEGWKWEQSESRTISDVDVINETTRGNWARWRLQFNNLPKYKSSSISFDIGNNVAARGTMDLHTSWLWYDKNGKDNQDRTPYDLCIWLRGDYQHQNFTTTGADLFKKDWSWGQTFTIQLPKIVNVTAGHLALKNDLPDGMTLSNVKVARADTGEEISEFENTIPNGGEQVLGFYNSNYKYMVTFKAKKNGETARTYKYTLNPSIRVSHKATTTLYAASDFTAQ